MKKIESPKVKEINMLENQMDKAAQEEDWDKYFQLSDKLEKLDPFNDIFHLACPNWPNCDIAGCGDGRSVRI